MKILITGVAGFIGFHTAKSLLAEGQSIIGIDNLNDYYDVSLKHSRLNILKDISKKQGDKNFTFYQANIADSKALDKIIEEHENIEIIIHLAAQAGVRYSLENPYAYVESNLMGHVCMLELSRKIKRLRHFVYASSSSVYGGNTKLPFSVEDDVNSPVSLYAATKRADELMSFTYSHLYKIPQTGLRFFTVYGPWGRPDMAYFSFTKAILENKPINVFNNGKMERDFTYIDDIIDGIKSVMNMPPESNEDNVPHSVYNLGNHKSENLVKFIEVIEDSLGKKADKIFKPIPKGDVVATYADIEESNRVFNFLPKTYIEEGIPKFVEWYKEYYKI